MSGGTILRKGIKRIIAETGRVSLVMQQRNIDKDCRVLFGDIFIVPFLGSALGLTTMCRTGWGNLVAIDWNDLPMGI